MRYDVIAAGGENLGARSRPHHDDVGGYL